MSFDLLRFEQIRDFSGIENSVQIFKESLVDDLRIGEEEDAWFVFRAGDFVQFL